MGGPVSELEAIGEPTSGPVLEVIVLAAEDLKNVNMMRKMSVYVVAWVEPRLKRSTCVRHKTGRNTVWNVALLFPVTDAILLHPHSTLTVQVYSTGTMSPSVVGTTYLAFRDIARMKATKTYSEEGDVVTLPLLRRSGRTQGSIKVFVNLTGATIQQMMYALDNGVGFRANEMPTTFSSSSPEGVAVMGYPAVQPCKFQASFYRPSLDDDVNAAFWPSAPPLALAASLAASSTLNFTGTPENQTTTPPPTRPPPVPSDLSPLFSNHSNVDPHPYAQARNQYVPVRIRRPQEGRENFVLALISGVGGLVGGLVLGDIISAALRWF